MDVLSFTAKALLIIYWSLSIFVWIQEMEKSHWVTNNNLMYFIVQSVAIGALQRKKYSEI